MTNRVAPIVAFREPSCDTILGAWSTVYIPRLTEALFIERALVLRYASPEMFEASMENLSAATDYSQVRLRRSS